LHFKRIYTTLSLREAQGWFPAVVARQISISENSAYGEPITPDIVTPAQWWVGGRREDPRFHGTKQLMLAVLVDALQGLQNCTASDSVIKRQRLAEVEAWIADRDAQGPFAFETVCEALGIDADYLRSGLRAWQRQQLSGMHSHRQVRRSPNRPTGRIGSPVRRRRRRAKEAALADQPG
jgi:hypothetical protein